MRALIITRHYLDQNLGGPNCSKAFVKAVSGIYPQCTVIYPEHNGHDTDLTLITASGTITVPCYDKRSKIRKLIDVYRGTLHRFRLFTREFLKDNVFDVIFIDHSLTASSGIMDAVVGTGSKIVTLHHNVEKNYIRDNKPGLLYRLPYRHFALKAEHEAVMHSDLNLTLTRADYEYFAGCYPEKQSSFDVMNLFEYNTGNAGDVADNAEDNLFIISGSLGAAQTETALLKFMKEYMPVLNRIVPNGRLVITGRNPSKKLCLACKDFDNITVVPNPEDLQAVMAAGKYYICPLHTGSGIKLRIMDALHIGLPVVAHEVSARGYENITDAGFMFVYSDKETFEIKIKELLNANIHRDEVKDSYMATFSYNAGKSRLEDILNEHGML